MQRDVTDSYITHALTKLNGRFGALPAAFVEDEDSATLGIRLLDDGHMPPRARTSVADALPRTSVADALLGRTLAERRAVKQPIVPPAELGVRREAAD